MTFRFLSACSLLCVLGCLSASAQNAEAPYPPFRAGSVPPLVQMTPATMPQVVPATTATWTKAKKAPPVSVGTMLLLTRRPRAGTFRAELRRLRRQLQPLVHPHARQYWELC